MAHLPIPQIKKFLFSDQEIRDAIISDYNLEKKPTNNANELANSLVASLGQAAKDNPESLTKSNSAVFKAAVLAIASSSTKWSYIQKKKKKIASTLCDFDPQSVQNSPRDEIQQAIVDLLPGQNQTANANAILAWAKLLSNKSSFYNKVICNTYAEIIDRPSWSKIDPDKHYPMAVLCMAGIFANPVNDWAKLKQYKFPGMLVPIACEFLRNLGWDGFKPDRHINRIVALWERELRDQHGEKVDESLCHLRDIIDTSSKTTLCPIKSAIYAIYATPKGVSYSETDNLLWAFVSYFLEHREKDIVNLWLKKQFHIDALSIHELLDVSDLGKWPKSLICPEY